MGFRVDGLGLRGCKHASTVEVLLLQVTELDLKAGLGLGGVGFLGVFGLRGSRGLQLSLFRRMVMSKDG